MRPVIAAYLLEIIMVASVSVSRSMRLPNAARLPSPHAPSWGVVSEDFAARWCWEIEQLIGTAFASGALCATEVRDLYGRWWRVEVEPLDRDYRIGWYPV